MPYATPVRQRDGSTMTYDSGDYPECQRRVLAAGGLGRAFAARREAALRQGRWLGIGLANYVEGTGRGPFESASIRIGPSGKIVVATGATAQGQGIKTMLAQLAAGVLGVPTERDSRDRRRHRRDTARTRRLCQPPGRHRRQCDRDRRKRGGGEGQRGSRGDARGVRLDDLELIDGEIRVKGVPGLKKTLAEVAYALGGMPGYRPARQHDAGACRGQRLSAAGHELHQRRPCLRGRGRSRDRRRHDPALCRDP